MMRAFTCKTCGCEFQANHGLKKYCSRVCYNQARVAAGKQSRDRWSPERRRAYVVMRQAIRTGKLVPQPCEVCGASHRPQAHHDDYNKPLEVRWLCTPHHHEHHKKFGPAIGA